MAKNVLITGISVSQQMKRANEILENQVIPREEEFQKRKLENTLSPELLSAIKSNA